MDIPLFFYLTFKDLDRLAPGSDESTLNVLNLIDIDKDLKMDILEVGCGTGSDTLILADYFRNSTVEAIDLFPHYLKVLNQKIDEKNLGSRVYAYEMDMNDLDFANEEIDLLFCHAGVEIMGFKKALNRWRRVIKPDGFLIVSDLTWISSPSRESTDFWKSNYEEIDTIENKITQLEKLGFEYINHYVLDKSEFAEYYSQLNANLDKIKSDKSAKDFIKQLKKEVNVSKNEDFSYVYYIMRKSNRR
ncbi:class I SAM-dependent methyltransferase [Methanobrevibacter millerae]|uniref:Ubiquinone/menaquinone biosynthesis C-methylase UbiE n=1 Tax=Methanobrevibacter millerae TaxID=230361 RepID=A0A1G5XS92_9EURY|nr:class I SAM-dependent methyltransferase [Methanobrevibacter millerae]SDA72784.1 Ubiquinone/menaquinone biosynthesis C-methylase UbiE [Methanobrevibacter millerae]